MDFEAEIAGLKDRAAKLEQSQTGLRTAFVKLVPLVEETRLRVSSLENSVAEIKQDVATLKQDVATLKHDLSALRKDLPGIVGDALREVLRDKR